MRKLADFSHRSLVLILLGIGFAFLMTGNGLLNLTDPDEVFYTQTAQEMLSHHSWLTPYLFDQPQFEKPVFFYWLLMISLKLFGSAPFVIRFWPALFGMLSAVGVYGVSWLLFHSKRLSFLAGLVLCTSFIHFGMSKAVLTDMVFAFWITAAMGCFYWGYTSARYKNWGIVLFFACGAFAVLTKGLLGICLPLMGVHLYLRVKQDLAFFNCRAALLGIVIFLGIAGPWHVLMYQWYGKPFIDEYWYNAHIRRIFEAEHKSANTWYFYPAVLMGGMMPWTFFLLPSLFSFGKAVVEPLAKIRNQSFFLFAWLLGTLIVPQIAKSKLASYILPAFPPLVIMVAYYFNDLFEKKEQSSFWRSLWIGARALAAVIVVGAIALTVFAKRQTQFVTPQDMNHFYLFAVLLVLCATTVFISTIQKNLKGVLTGVVGILVAIMVTISLIYRSAEPWVSCKEISDVLQKSSPSNSLVFSNKLWARGIRFYTQRPVAVIHPGAKEFFSPHPIPFLNDFPSTLKFLEHQSVIYGVVGKGTLRDFESMLNPQDYQMATLTHIGDKYLVRIERRAQ